MKKIRKAYNFRLKPTPEIEQRFDEFANACRFIWNKSLAVQKEKLETKEKLLSEFDINRLIVKWKNNTETLWLKNINMKQEPLRMSRQSVSNLCFNYEKKKCALD